MIVIKNQVQLIGRAGNQPELKKFENGRQMIRLRVATQNVYKSTNGQRSLTTQWHTVIAWGNLAEHMSNHITKGGELGIRGKLVHRSYEDREGIDKVISEVVATEFLMMQQTTNEAA